MVSYQLVYLKIETFVKYVRDLGIYVFKTVVERLPVNRNPRLASVNLIFFESHFVCMK